MCLVPLVLSSFIVVVSYICQNRFFFPLDTMLLECIQPTKGGGCTHLFLFNNAISWNLVLHKHNVLIVWA